DRYFLAARKLQELCRAPVRHRQLDAAGGAGDEERGVLRVAVVALQGIDDVPAGAEDRVEANLARGDVGDQIAEAVDGDDRPVDLVVAVRRRGGGDAREIVDG